MSPTLVRAFTFSLVLGAGVARGFEEPAKATRPAAEEKTESPLEVNEWSVWVGNPALTSWNSARVYKNTMPGVVGTSRPKLDEKEAATKFPIAPISVVQFFGEACKDIDVDLRAKKGLFLAHWPVSTERSGRLQWFGSSFSAEPPADIPPSYLPENHWLTKLRDDKSSLFLKFENHYDRFVAYDSELNLTIPLRLRGGPDEYTLQNLTNRRLIDIAVIAPTDDGIRVGWLDTLPSASTDDADKEKEKEKAKDKDKDKPSDKEKADAIFNEAEEKEKDKDKPKDKDKEEEIPPLPAEGDATIKARVDQLLNRPVTVTVQQAPRKSILDLITGQIRLRYDVDDKTLAKDGIDLSQPANMQANNLPARDALADILGSANLSYRVTEDGSLYVSTAARLAEDSGKKGGVIEGPPVKLGMSQPIKPTHSSFKEVTRDAFSRRLASQGLKPQVIQTILDQYGKSLFEPGELIVLAHLPRETIDEAVVLDVFPAPKKMVRTAMLVVHGVDPRLQDRARVLVQQLGDDSAKARETAEGKLFDLGPVAVPVLEEALTNKDIEIVFRAERLLLRLNRNVP